MKTSNILIVGPNGFEEAKETKLPDYCILHGFGGEMVQYKAVVLPSSYDRYGCQSCIILNKENPYIRQFENHIRPLRKKFGIGLYYDDDFKLSSYEEVAPYITKALEIEEANERAEQEAKRIREENTERGKKIFLENLPADAVGVIIAELRVNESDLYTDYFGYSTSKRVILAFTNKKRHDFNEMRKAAANCTIEDIAKLSIRPVKPENAPDYWTPDDEHRENYSGGGGYYLGLNKYSGWCIYKNVYVDLKNNTDLFEAAGQENGFFAYKSNAVTTEEKKAPNIERVEVEPGKIKVIEYSEKAIAVIGDTRSIKDKLKELGGKFNFRLSCGPGWIFSKSKLEQLKEALAVRTA